MRFLRYCFHLALLYNELFDNDFQYDLQNTHEFVPST